MQENFICFKLNFIASDVIKNLNFSHTKLTKGSANNFINSNQINFNNIKMTQITFNVR